jgi:predicted DNA-binding transcriptional regulator AlpA
VPRSRTDLHVAITEAGGIVALSQLPERLGLSKSRVYQLAERGDFPEPIGVVAQNVRVYLVAEVDAWHAQRRAAIAATN